MSLSRQDTREVTHERRTYSSSEADAEALGSVVWTPGALSGSTHVRHVSRLRSTKPGSNSRSQGLQSRLRCSGFAGRSADEERGACNLPSLQWWQTSVRGGISSLPAPA